MQGEGENTAQHWPGWVQITCSSRCLSSWSPSPDPSGATVYFHTLPRAMWVQLACLLLHPTMCQGLVLGEGIQGEGGQEPRVTQAGLGLLFSGFPHLPACLSPSRVPGMWLVEARPMPAAAMWHP